MLGALAVVDADGIWPHNLQNNSRNVLRGKPGVNTVSSVHDVLGLFNRGYSVEKIAAMLKMPITNVYASIASIAEFEYRMMMA